MLLHLCDLHRKLLKTTIGHVQTTRLCFESVCVGIVMLRERERVRELQQIWWYKYSTVLQILSHIDVCVCEREREREIFSRFDDTSIVLWFKSHHMERCERVERFWKILKFWESRNVLRWCRDRESYLSCSSEEFLIICWRIWFCDQHLNSNFWIFELYDR